MTFEYSPAPESTAIVDIRAQYGLFINGKFVAAKGSKTFNTINPATEKVLSKIAYAQASDVDKAVAAARTAYTKVWSKMAPQISRRVKACLQKPGRQLLSTSS